MTEPAPYTPDEERAILWLFDLRRRPRPMETHRAGLCRLMRALRKRGVLAPTRLELSPHGRAVAFLLRRERELRAEAKT